MESESKQIDELKELIRQNTAITRETHAMVRSMHKSAQRGRFLKMLWFAAVVALSVGAYIYMAPYLNQIIGMYEQAQNAIDHARQFGQFTR